MSRRTFFKAATVAGVSAVLGSQLASCGSAKKTSYDVVVIGAGVIGCCTARELARYKTSVLVIEAGLDIASGATRANSGIVHTGYDPEPGTLKAKYNVAGAPLFAEWQKELGFAYFQNGALVVAFNQEEMDTLHKLQERAKKNGAPEAKILSGWEARSLEPNLSSEAVGALSVPESGVVDPYGFTFGAAENAAENGVEFVFGSRVSEVKKSGGGYSVTVEGGQTYSASVVVNAAGVYADEINNMVSANELKITPRRGEYYLLRNDVHAFTRTMFQAPTKDGKGVLVTTAAFGNQIIGPNSVKQKSKDDVSTTREGLAEVLRKARRTWPNAGTNRVISTYAGLRATNAKTGDFVVGQAEDAPGFFNAACIDSPGLASAPAIATDLAEQVAGCLKAALNDQFNPVRQGAPLMAMMDDKARDGMIKSDPLYGNAVCQCCNVTEGELVAALHRSIPVLSFDALKWRTGATMGPCQGGRCMARILEIIARELKISPVQVQKRLEESNMMVQAAHTAPTDSAVKTGPLPQECNVLVIGSNPAALAMAAKAAQDLTDAQGLPEGAAPTVVLASHEPQVVFGTDSLMIPSNMTVCANAFATNIASVDDVWAAHDVTFLSPDGVVTVRAAVVVLANGAYEKPRASYVIPGSRPAGVYSAQTALDMLRFSNALPGDRVVVWGNTPLAQQCIDELHAAGLVVDHFKSGHVAQIDGAGRPEQVTFMAGKVDDAKAVAAALSLDEEVDQEEGAQTGTGSYGQGETQGEGEGGSAGPANALDDAKVSIRKVLCDTFIISADMLPELRLANMAQVNVNENGRITVDEAGRTSVPGIYAGGTVVHPNQNAEEELAEAERVGEGAAAAAVSLLT